MTSYRKYAKHSRASLREVAGLLETMPPKKRQLLSILLDDYKDMTESHEKKRLKELVIAMRDGTFDAKLKQEEYEVARNRWLCRINETELDFKYQRFATRKSMTLSKEPEIIRVGRVKQFQDAMGVARPLGKNVKYIERLGLFETITGPNTKDREYQDVVSGLTIPTAWRTWFNFLGHSTTRSGDSLYFAANRMIYRWSPRNPLEMEAIRQTTARSSYLFLDSDGTILLAGKQQQNYSSFDFGRTRCQLDQCMSDIHVLVRGKMFLKAVELPVPDDEEATMAVYVFDKGKISTEGLTDDDEYRKFTLDLCEFERARVELVAHLLKQDDVKRHVLKYLVADEAWI